MSTFTVTARDGSCPDATVIPNLTAAEARDAVANQRRRNRWCVIVDDATGDTVTEHVLANLAAPRLRPDDLDGTDREAARVAIHFATRPGAWLFQ